MSNPYGRTSGTDQRPSRPLMERLMVFRPDDEIRSLRAEDEWVSGERNSRTLAKDVDFRVVLSLLHGGAELDEQDGAARASVQILDGTAVLHVAGDEQRLEAGDLAVINAGEPWSLRAEVDAAVLLTLAWPVAKTGV
jgi:quercetin dioxygenase-like cupin family protein